MPGASSSATPAQREEFEQRCRDLYAEVSQQQSAFRSAGTADVTTIKDLEDMFPALDPALIHLLAADAGSPLLAMETLLALAAAAPAETNQDALPAMELGLNDNDAFPCLVDADGWQLPSEQLFARNPEADLGSAWCERAKVVASMPSPAVVSYPKSTLATYRKTCSRKQEAAIVQDASSDGILAETEHEFRIRHGRQRINNRTRFQAVRRTSPTPTSSCPAAQYRETASNEEQVSVNVDTDTNEDDSAGTSSAL